MTLLVSALLLAVLGLGAPGPVSAGDQGDPYFETVGDAETIPNGVVTALAQDQTGFLWIGTQAGLLRYDGHRFRPFRHDPGDPRSLGDESIRDLLPLPDGQLWIATQGGGLSIFDPRSETFQRLRHDPADPHSLAEDSVLEMVRDADGGIWMALPNQGLDYWDAKQKRFQHFPNTRRAGEGPPHDTVRCLLIDRAGDLWLGTRNGLARKRAGSTRFESVASDPAQADSLAGQYVYGLFQASDGRIWAGTQNHGAVVIDPDSGGYTRLAVDPDSPTGLSHPWVSTLVEPYPGQLWVFTFGGGIDVLDAASMRVIQRVRHDPATPSSLALDLLTQPLIDRSGLLWLGTWGAGLQKHNISARAFRSLRHSPLRSAGLSAASVLSALAWPDGRLWLGAGGQGIDVYDPDAGWLPGLRADPEAPGALRDGTVRAMARTRDGTVWVGTQQAGLHRWLDQTRGFRRVPGATGSDDERIVLLQATRDGSLLVASQRGLAELDPASERVRRVGLAAGEAFTDTVVQVIDDPEGNLWVASTVGLLVRAAGQIGLRRVPAAPGQPGSLANGTILSLHVDAQGQLWIAHPAGLDRQVGWSQGLPQFAPVALTNERALANFAANHLLSDDQGRLWTERLVIEPATGRVHEFGRADGVELGSTSLGASLRLSDGRLLFGGTRGALLIAPDRYQPWQFQPPLLVTAVQIDGNAVPQAQLTEGVQVPPGQRRLDLEFSALDFSAPDRLRYAYRLQGFEENWQSGDASRRSAQYTGLWPGRYTLEVRASNRAGEWSPTGLRVPIRVLPAWWQTPAFALVMAALLAGLVVTGVRVRTRRINQRAMALEALVRQRTGELSQAKERAEEALAELKGAQKQLVAAEKMASLGQLVAGVAHEINTPIGIAVTAASHMQELSRGFAGKADAGKLTRSDLSSWRAAVEEAVRLILGSLERAHGLIGSFKQVAVDQSSEQRRSFDLATFLGEVRFALQPSYKRTPHTLDIDCPPGIELDTYPGALFQVFTNLVNNSLLHAFAMGQSGTMRIVARASGDHVDFLYSDDGQGMSGDVVARAFDPFFTTRRGTGGSGLGLHLVYNLTTQLLAGHIELHSAPGQGTEFELSIPRSAPAHPPGDLAGAG